MTMRSTLSASTGWAASSARSAPPSSTPPVWAARAARTTTWSPSSASRPSPRPSPSPSPRSAPPSRSSSQRPSPACVSTRKAKSTASTSPNTGSAPTTNLQFGGGRPLSPSPLPPPHLVPPANEQTEHGRSSESSPAFFCLSFLFATPPPRGRPRRVSGPAGLIACGSRACARGPSFGGPDQRAYCGGIRPAPPA